MSLLVFYIIAAIALGSATGVVVTKNVVHSAIFLLITLGAIAAFFILLLSEFLALVQILIYGGAVVIVILFALMLTKQGEFQEAAEHTRWPGAAFVSGALFVILISVFVADAPKFGSASEIKGVSVEVLARTLFEDWAVPFEIASIVLLVALIGAIVIARADREGDQS